MPALLKYPRLVIGPKTGTEPFENTGHPSPPTVIDFWRWGFSNLVDNTTRAVLAEFLVASAIGPVTGTRSAWDSYDLRLNGDLTIEVKASAYLQAWGHKQLSKIVFSIRPSRAYDPDTGELSADVRHQAKVYVFCLLDHQDQATLDPLDTRQWKFFVLPTKVLDERCPQRKTITLASLVALKPVCCTYADLKTTIEAAGE